MDDTTLQSLKAAYELSPGNHALLLVILRAHLEREEAAAARALIEGRNLDAITVPADRLVLAQIHLQGEDAEQALSWLTSEDADTQIIRARALLALERMDEAHAAYQRAVAANAALQDMDLEARFSGKVRSLPPRQPGGPRLTVISNDDTADLEVDRMIEPELERVSFAQIGGLEDVKAQIRRKVILPFQKPSLFQRFKKRAGGGILLYGPPGCGKTMIARATAGECNAKFLNIAISDVLDMYIGESERKLHALFERARQSAPAVMFFDEIEALGGKRQYSRESVSAKVVSQFLAEMDGFAQNNAGVLVLGATNVPWAVDPAFRRPGRFDRVQFVPPPDREARVRILELLLEDRPIEGRIDTAWLAQHTAAFSGADLRNLVESAVEEAIEASIDAGREVPLTDTHLRNALRSVKPTTLEWLSTARNHARYANEGGQYDEVLAFLDKHGK